MKNKEKYAIALIRHACTKASTFGVSKNRQVFDCYGKNADKCTDCIFNKSGDVCEMDRKQWLEEEYIEPYYLTREEKVLLDMLDPRWFAMARNEDNGLYLYDLLDAYHLEKVGSCWENNTGADCCVGWLGYFIGNSYFQMVKWEDNTPWLISDLKKMKVQED